MKNKIVLYGNLKFLSLGDIVQLLGANASSGVLRLISRYAQDPAFVYFRKGNPINATIGERSGLEAFYALFGWQEGDFEFIKEEVPVERLIQKSRMGLILEGYKMVDDGQIEIVGPASSRRIYSSLSSEDGFAATPIIKGPLVDYMYVVDEEDFFDSELIVEEGKHGNWIWVILEGVAEITKDTPQGRVPLLRIGDGCFIGSLATFLIQGNIRTATSIAVGNVQLGVLDSQRLAQEYAKLSTSFRFFLSSLDKRLKQISKSAADQYTKTADINSYIKSRTPMIRQGEDTEKFYQIRRGEISIVRKTEHGQVGLARLGQNDYFGHLPFLDLGHEPEHASILVSKDLVVDTVDVNHIQDEYDQLSTTFRNIVDNVASCIATTSNVTCNYHQKRHG